LPQDSMFESYDLVRSTLASTPLVLRALLAGAPPEVVNAGSGRLADAPYLQEPVSRLVARIVALRSESTVLLAGLSEEDLKRASTMTSDASPSEN
jgi:hypothetical protein